MNNIAILYGRFVADPEIRMTTSNKQVASFTVAISRSKDKVDYIDCVAWETTAQLICRFGAKGGRVNIIGQLETRTWTDKNGSSHKNTYVRVNDFTAIDYKEAQRTEEPAPNFTELTDDEIPF